ncbi:MAG: hypothetical protein AAF693_09610 [Bacteroidota bacterium]
MSKLQIGWVTSNVSLLLTVTSLLLPYHTKSQLKMTSYEINFNNAHDNAKKILTEEFYWNPVEEGSPFGNDDGYDAFYSFYDWRKTNLSENPVKFIYELLESWGYPKFDVNTLDQSKIESYINNNTSSSSQLTQDHIDELRKHMKEMAEQAGKELSEEQFQSIINETSGNMGGTYLMSIDNAIIAIGFGQYVLEGTINEELQALTRIALERESMEILIQKYIPEYRESRMKILSEMKKDLKLMKN